MSDSFSPGDVATGPAGQLANPGLLEQSNRLERKLYEIGDRAWCLVGNGLSNQTFIEGPEGLIVIDTGECEEEMAEALGEIRSVTSAPVAACIYSHFHYANGTTVLVRENGGERIPIWGHAGIEANLQRFGGEVGPRSSRGLVHQFAVGHPESGADGLVNVGLGRFFRNPGHAPFTSGHIPADHTFDEPVTAMIAGLEVQFFPAPSDATDSVTIWFPSLGVAVNNLVWPALFNVFAIRGEEYRDPRILLKGLDQLHGLGADHLIATHGPPVSGREEIAGIVLRYRDSIQFMWDQTVRLANLGFSPDEMIDMIALPESFKDHYTTTQYYGLVEHHVRQIYAGLFGWFDENEMNLFPLPLAERATRMVEGFGGADAVRAQADAALEGHDYRWAIELSSWLVRSQKNDAGRADAGTPEDRARLASALRGVAQSTTSANVRNWCITRALELEGEMDIERFRGHRLRRRELQSLPVRTSLALLRVKLQPGLAGGLGDTVTFHVDGEEPVGFTVRNCVAVTGDTVDGSMTVRCSKETFAAVISGELKLIDALDDDRLHCDDHDRLKAIFGCFGLG